MAGWSHNKRTKMELNFYKFLQRCYVNSKDKGRICLADHLYDGQVKFIDTVFDSMEKDIHKIFVLKSRQLGLSTIARAMSIFWLGMHDGLKGALVFDTAPHKESARKELVTMIKNLPFTLGFPQISGTGSGNRESMTLMNESIMLFMSAGVRAAKGSGTLGRSEGLTLAHCSEICSYDNPEGLKSFDQSLSEEHPDRLYIYESTARGFNVWKAMWDRAKADEHHCACLFLGWWSKPSQSIPETSVDFELYGRDPPTDEELEKIKAVREQYEHEVSPGQLAWIRRKLNPSIHEDSDSDDTDDSVMMAEQAWTEQEAFQQSGSVFFASKDLTDMTNKFVRRKCKAYMFMSGDEFKDMKIYPAQNTRSVELRVWEEPEPEGVYVMGVDPAYGENEDNARSSIQMLRCYADGIDQVAEYASPLITTRHLAWVMAAMLGWYGSERAEARYILELNGPGTAVFNEIRNLRFYLENARYEQKDLSEKGLTDVFRNVKTYIFSRPDAMGSGYNYHWLTNTRLKITLMEQLRDVASNGKLHIRSLELIEEMRSISREGDSIGAPSSMQDDRVIAIALAAYYWSTKIRNPMIATKRTRAAEEARKSASIVDRVNLFNQNNLEMFFAQKRQVRANDWLQMQRQAWRNRQSRRY